MIRSILRKGVFNLSIIKSLPKYDDDEVRVFHPICESALNRALVNLGLEDDYEVKHHETVGSLEADFVLIRRTTGKYVLFIEVKRKPAAVSSTRYRIQAQSYVQEARSAVELPYYAITNLEVLDVFKYDNSRPSVTQQIIEPSPVRVGNFSDDPAKFFENLVGAFVKTIRIVINDQGSYKELTGSFIPMLEDNKSNRVRWHQSLVVAGYEYIRGVLNANNRRVPWRTALTYKNRPSKLIDNIKSINFNSLTLPPVPVSKDNEIWNTVMLQDIAELGQKTMSGDELAELIHSIAIAGREHEGLVPTDLELANILAILSRHELNRDLLKGEIICDPAAGSGNLLSSSKSGFQNIKPKQLWANDNEPLFPELLSIRLGLMFPTVVSPNNSPKVTEKDIIELDKDEFRDVRVVLMNPPYVSGVKDPITKKKVAARIFDINGEMSNTYVGQVGIEAPFLELVTSLVENETVISVVFPKQYLTTKGREASAFRQFLLNEFGLTTIFMYPREGIFQDVIKDTVVIIGCKNIEQKQVKVITSEIPLANIDLTKLKQGLNKLNTDSSLTSLTYGVNVRKMSTSNLEENINEGWRNLTVLGENVEKWIHDTVALNSAKLSTIHDLKRGRIGNAGASDLLFINTNNRFWYTVQDYVPVEWLYPALRTVKEIDSIFVNSSTTEVRFFAPPEESFQSGTKEYDILETILDIYIDVQSKVLANTKQRKKVKTKEELRNIINRERKKITNEYTILVPRNIRRFARIFITTEKSYVSTNVIEVTGGSIEEKWITTSWLQSIFSQLQFEGMAKDQEGTRKLEEGSIGDLLIPEIKNVSKDAMSELIKHTKNREEFLDLCNPQLFDVDKIWSEIISPSETEEALSGTLSLLEERVAERFPEYSQNVKD
ncbi:BpuSI family type II restriction endonuclease [Virgibacillus halodenitrificans]|uniref:BpuSI family type II restriction endonuclease n=1 Tax=Virgibacillus halodenitrificans TaxID=1482 RepID=UPI0024BFD62C|nr:BpuSI family type II restriction endonuclease [Virgibacillus halodenitrificans]WHX25657.1 BpuSI family type II restriction endonuclease [Virgibacillus halodenitrificans]